MRAALARGEAPDSGRLLDGGGSVRKFIFGVCVGALLLVAHSSSAHHSFAMFDRSKETTLVGVVHEFQWTNPHSWIELDVANDSGGLDKWSIELNSPNNLSRQGWKSDSVKPGDRISVVIWPLRSGEKGGLFISLTLPDGSTLDEAAFRHRPKP